MFRVTPVTVVLCLAACVPSADGPSTMAESTTTTLPPATSTTLGPADSVAAFVGCLQERGVDTSAVAIIGEPATDLGSLASVLETSDPAVQAAVAECAELLSAAQIAHLTGDPEVRTLVADQLGLFAECMRTEGIEGFPDPLLEPLPRFDPESVPFDTEGFEVALETCRALVGNLGIEG